MTTASGRAGVTLVELLVASLLLLIVFAIGSLAARRTLGSHYELALVDARASAVSDALATLARHAAGVHPPHADLHVARDTALEFTRDIGVTVVCRTSQDTVIVGTGGDSVPWSTHLPRAITTDDALRVFDDADATWHTLQLRSVNPTSAPCADSLSAPLGSATYRLVVSDSNLVLRTGAVAIVRQRERWSLVRGGDGQWSLSLATWDAASGRFVVPQPLLTPLAAPNGADGPGLRVRAIGADGGVVTDSALASAAAILVTLRTTRHARRGTFTDSIRINVAPN